MRSKIPHHWKWLPFESLLSEPLRNGIYKKKEFHGRGTPIINMGELFGYPRFDGSCELKRVELTEKELDKNQLVCGDLIFARRSLTAEGAGKCSIIRKLSEPTGFESSIIRARLDQTKADPEYFYYLFNSPFGKWLLGTILRQVAVSGITGSDLAKLEVPVPPLNEQSLIAKQAISIDDKVAINTSINQSLEQMAQAIFKSWFVDFDPVKAKMNGEQPEGMDTATASLFPEKLVESELGLIPDGWDIGSIEDVTSKVFSGGTPATKNKDFWGGDLPWFSSGETRNNFIIGTEKYITEAGVRGSSTKASAYGDVLIASAGQGHTRGQTSFNSIDCYINQSVVALRSADNVSAYWLYYNLERRYDEMRSVSDSHSSRGSLTTKLLKGMPAIIPSKEIVIAFDRIVESLVRKQVANSNQNEELSALRDTLLPKLLSGEIELGATEAMESEV